MASKKKSYGYVGAYRDLTKRFRQLRSGYKSDYVATTEKSNSRESANQLLLNMDNTSNLNTVSNVPFSSNLPPLWLETLQSIDADIDTVSMQITDLKNYHSERLKSSMFNDEKSAECDANIQETTRNITMLVQGCKRKLQEIASKGIEDSKAGFEDRTVRFNVMRSRATKIQELTKQFREAQRNYLQELKNKEQRGNKYIDNESITQILPENIADGFNEEQLLRLKQIERTASDRTQEILNIAKSVHELATLFQELSVLVVEQGSLLDRIDYNVEQTLDNLSKAKVHIDKADKHQKRSRSALCIIVLIMLILVAGFILMIRQLSK
mmetsp:Transcript_13323/g.20144  ORF Transcript_13323/g.20144 Transcript_13323/m.20144 type:complete len:325 (-) Transcript_13323:103-1077(-)|eukprot:CAMPEP_0202686936 /NCGR_PEP_ID=MMETSP1385-20130828/2685_1 /ASSEMBLY_ACC=CAM_ASM_000861 /TAXON_ID=933848 /ORGANISM="Elphidium margaritaceum" /LENGTH=324 /DNA_ID=CAMNT_0049341617 /DNA_START=24 /DNA_END=998 /DNA_ORIENTATION=+